MSILFRECSRLLGWVYAEGSGDSLEGQTIRCPSPKLRERPVLIRVTCYGVSLYVIDFTCALNLGEAQPQSRDGSAVCFRLCGERENHPQHLHHTSDHVDHGKSVALCRSQPHGRRRTPRRKASAAILPLSARNPTHSCQGSRATPHMVWTCGGNRPASRRVVRTDSASWTSVAY
jgi:hypothetical protein